MKWSMPNNNLLQALPVITELTLDLADGRLSPDEIQNLIAHAGPLLTQLLAAALVAQPPANPAPAPAQPAPPVPVAPAPAPASGAKLRIIKLTARLTGVYDRNNVGAGDVALARAHRGDNTDNGYIFHTDGEATLEDGTVLQPGDPRWRQVNRWAPNGNAIFPYYEYNGVLTDIRHGDHGTPSVNPFSFVDDEGMTVSFQVDTAEPHNTQAGFRFGLMHKNEDGTFVDSGLIGQGNVSDGKPFLFR